MIQKNPTARYAVLTLGAMLAMPFFAHAQAIGNIFELFQRILGWLGALMPIGIGIITLVVMWNLAQFVLHAGDERERDKYKQFMIWSVIAMFLLVSFWGLVYFVLGSFFDIDDPSFGTPGYIDKNGASLP